MSKSHPRIAVFPGTFDPITLGHVDVISRARKLFDRLIVAIGHNPEKTEVFPIAQRLAMIRSVIRKYPNVAAESYEGLTFDFVKRHHAVAIVRGLRNMTDLEFEFQIALTNRAVAGVETVFIMTGEEFAFTSSSLIKQIVALGGDPKQFASLLPPIVITQLKHYKERKLGAFRFDPKDHLKS